MTPDQNISAPAAEVPTAGIDPRIALASTLQSSRTTAVLLGSGISSSAGIPTGWGVTLDLIARVAQAEGVNTTEGFEPDVWWREQGRSEPSYDELVAGLAPNDHDRRLLLRGYFEIDQRTGEAAEPTPAHRALAALIARGSVPVVVTTNFDQLLERALADVGVTPQILSSPSHVAARTPLAHAQFTLVKIHGDYASGHLRNAPAELATYPAPWKALLRQIFDEYGLLVAGWSAQYDIALREALRTTVGRRYAWYWATYHGDLAADAKQLTGPRHAHMIDTAGCHDLFEDLAAQVAKLDHVARRGSAWRPQPVVNALHQRPQGWASMPCIVTRATAVLSAGDPASTGQLFEPVRTELIAALNVSDVTTLLAEFGQRPAVCSVPQRVGQPATPNPPNVWETAAPMQEAIHGHPLQPHQSGFDAVLRCGSDGVAGVTAAAEVHLAGTLGIGDLPSVTLDIGLSIKGGCTVQDLAALQHAALVGITQHALPTLASVLPVGAGVRRLELSWDCPSSFDGTNRPVPVEFALDVSLLGPPSRTVGAAGAYAEAVHPPYSPEALARFVRRAWQTSAINAGYLHAHGALEASLLR